MDLTFTTVTRLFFDIAETHYTIVIKDEHGTVIGQTSWLESVQLDQPDDTATLHRQVAQAVIKGLSRGVRTPGPLSNSQA